MRQQLILNPLRYWSFHEIYGLRGSRFGQVLLDKWCAYQGQHVFQKTVRFTTIETLEMRLADGQVGVIAFDRIRRNITAHSLGCMVLTVIKEDCIEGVFRETGRRVVFDAVDPSHIAVIYRQLRQHIHKSVMAHYVTHGLLTSSPALYFYHQNQTFCESGMPTQET